MLRLKRMVIFLMATTLILAAAACGQSGGDAVEDTIVINDGQFSEMWIVHYMVKLLVEEHTGAKVEIRDEMSPPNSYNEIVRGNADLMNCYDGTLLTTFLHLDPSDVPAGTSLFNFVNEKGAEKGVMLLDKLGTNNTYIMATPMHTAERLNLRTTSDLIPVADQLVFGAEHDFFTEEGSAKFNPLVAFYGLNFKEVRQIDMGLKYMAIDNGSIDVTVAYATDGRNRQADLKLLADDLHFFPEYNGAILVRTDLFERLASVAPNLKEVLNMLGGIFTDELMVELTYAVDIEERSVEEVSAGFLRNLGLIS